MIEAEPDRKPVTPQTWNYSKKNFGSNEAEKLADDLLPKISKESHFLALTYLSPLALLLAMAATTNPETVSFTVKGQIVIPRRIRREFEIENGTKAVVQATPEGILLKPITGAAIKRARGLLRRKPGEKPFRQWWSDYKKEEKKLEEARYARLRPR